MHFEYVIIDGTWVKPCVFFVQGSSYNSCSMIILTDIPKTIICEVCGTEFYSMCAKILVLTCVSNSQTIFSFYHYVIFFIYFILFLTNAVRLSY